MKQILFAIIGSLVLCSKLANSFRSAKNHGLGIVRTGLRSPPNFRSPQIRTSLNVVSLPLIPITATPLPLLASIIPGISLVQEALVINGLWFTLLSFSKQKSLTRSGLLHATILGIGLWSLLGASGWLVCVSYLILGSLVTKVKMQEKEKLGIAEKRGGARGPENVWGSAATAIFCAILAQMFPLYDAPLKVAYIASLATKLSDTFGSEIGKAYGRTTYLITTLARVPKGTEGAVSLEGTLAGVVGSLLMVAAGVGLGIISGNWPSVISCIVAAFVATTAESYIGAIFQDSIPWLTNELVNLINTLIGALVAIIIYTILV